MVSPDVGIPCPPNHCTRWGDNDRILRAPQKQALQALLDQPVETFPSCGHLPHIDQPRKVAERCQALLTHG